VKPWRGLSSPGRSGLILLLRILVAAVFLYAGVIKASASTQFALTLIPFTIIPIVWLPTIAWLLPILEILAGLLLLIGPTQRVGAGLVVLLCVGFFVVIGWALGNGIIVSCSCFGRDESPSAIKMALSLGRDVLLATAAGMILFLRR
jgi:putative oxidoreductase